MVLALCATSSGVNYIWSNPNSSIWGQSSNWGGASISGANSADDAYIHFAPFLVPGISSPHTVTLDGFGVFSPTVGRLLSGTNISLTLGTLTLSNPGSIIQGSLTTATSTTLTGAGTLTVNGPINLQGGLLSGTGKITANGGLLINYPAGGSTLLKPIDLFGSSAWNSGSVFSSGSTASTLVTNFGTFTINVPNGTTWNDYRNFINSPTGTVVKNLPSTIYMRMSNNGSLTVNNGTFEITNQTGVDDHAGDFSIASGASLRLRTSNRLLNGSTIIGPGSLRTEGTVEFLSGSTLSSPTLVQGGSLSFRSGATISLPASVSNTSATTNFDAGGTYNLSSATFSGFGNTVNGPMSVGPLSLTTGVLNGSGDITASGLVSLTGGTLSGTGKIIANSGLLVAFPAGGASILKPMDLSGTSNWNSGTIFGTSATPIPVVTNFGNFNVNSTSDVSWDTARNFVNAPVGTVNKTQPTTVSMRMANNGTLSVNDGTLEITNQAGSDDHAGDFSIATGANLRLRSANRLLNGSSIHGQGTLRTDGSVEFLSGSILSSSAIILGGTVTFRSGATISPPSSINNTGGTTSFDAGGSYSLASATFSGFGNTVNGPMSVGPLSLTTGVLNGSGDITASGLVSLTGGTLSGTGKIIANNGLVIAFPAGGASILKPMDLSGTSNWNSGTIFGTSAAPIPVVTNFGTFNVNATSDVAWDNARNFVNSSTGTVNKTQSSTASLNMTNSGTTNVNGGTLAVKNGSSDPGHAGTFNVSSGSVLALSSSNKLVAGSKIQGLGKTTAQGDVEFQSGSLLNSDLDVLANTVTFKNGSTVANTTDILVTPTASGLVFEAGGTFSLSSLTVQGGINTINSPLTTGALSVTAGTYEGSGATTVTGPLTFVAGMLNGTGSITAQGGIVLNGPAQRNIRKPMILQGASTWSEGSISLDPTGTVNLQGSLNISNDGLWDRGTFTNNGTITKTGGLSTSSTRFAAPSGNLINAGTVNVQGGNFQIQTDTSSAPGQVHTGVFNVSAGSELIIQGSTQFGNGARVQGSGTFNQNWKNATFLSGSVISTPIRVSAGAVRMQTGSAFAGNPPISIPSSNEDGIIISTGSAQSTGSITASPNAYVESSSNVVVNGGLTLNGRLVGSGSWTVTGVTTLGSVPRPASSSDTLIDTGGTLTASGGLIIGGTGGAGVDFRRPIVIGGSSQWNGVSVFSTSTTTVTGNLSISGSGTWLGGAISNSGTIEKTSGTGTTSFSNLTSLSSTGLIKSATGTLSVQLGGSVTGAINGHVETENPASIVNLIGNFQFGSDTLISGGGKTILQAGSSSFAAGATVSGGLEFLGSAISFQTGSNIKNPASISAKSSTLNLFTGGVLEMEELYIENSVITSSDNLLVTGKTRFLYGNLTTAGNQLLGGLDMTGPLERVFNNNTLVRGPSLWSGGSVTITEGAIFTHEGDLTIDGGTRWSGRHVFSNKGSITKLGTGSTELAYSGLFVPGSFSGAQFSNSGSVSVQAGDLKIGGFGNHTGTFTAATDAVLTFDSPQIFRAGSVSGAGKFKFANGNTEFQTGSTLTGDIAVTGGTVTFKQGSSANLLQNFNQETSGTLVLSTGAPKALTTLAVTKGQLSGSDPINVSGLTTLQGGNLGGTGLLTATGGINILGSLKKTLGKNILSPSTTQWSNGVIEALGGTFGNAGTFNMNGDLIWNWGQFNNTGTLIKTTGDGIGYLDPDVLTNSGVIEVRSGTLRIGNLSNLNLISGQLIGGVYRVQDGQTLQLGNLPGSIIGNGGVIDLYGPNSRFSNLNDTNSLAGLMSNSGTLNLQDGRTLDVPNGFTNTGNLVVGAGSSLTSSGTIIFQSGTVTLNGSIIAPNIVLAGGSLIGSGQISSSIVNNFGELSPGPGVTVLDVLGSYSQGPLGKMRIEVQGPTPQDHDVINIQGNLVLGGQFIVDLIPLASVPTGTRLRVVTATGTITGNFSVVPPDTEWSVIKGANFVDIIRVGAGQPSYPFSGLAVLEGWAGGNPVRAINLDFYSGSNLVVSRPISPDADLLYAYSFLTLLQGPHTVRASCPGFLDRVFPVTISLAGAVGVNFTMTPGDADGDNEVGPGDFEHVIALFGAISSDPDYDFAVDFDGDGEIGPSDFEIVVSNFGIAGDNLP